MVLAFVIETLPRQRAHELDPNIVCSCPILALDKSSITVAFLLRQIELVWCILTNLAR